MSTQQDFKDVLKIEAINAKGYGILPKMAMLDNRLSLESKAIYSYFFSYAGAGDQAFPSCDKIYFDLKLEKDRYCKHFKPLLRLGYIEVHQTKSQGIFKRNVYTLIVNPSEIVELATFSPCTGFTDTDLLDTEIPYTENQDTNIISSLKSSSLSINQRVME